MKLLLLFLEFFKTGLFAIGGGLATLPFLYDLAGKYDWFTAENLADMIAVSESTPGPIGVNMATYTGMTTAGLPGAILATVGLVLPSVIIIVLVAKFLERFRQNKLVDRAFLGLRPASAGLVAAACFSVIQIALLNTAAIGGGDWLSLFRLPQIVLFAILFVIYKKWNKLHPLFIILLGAVAGIALGYGGLL